MKKAMSFSYSSPAKTSLAYDVRVWLRNLESLDLFSHTHLAGCAIIGATLLSINAGADGVLGKFENQAQWHEFVPQTLVLDFPLHRQSALVAWVR